MWSPRSFLRPVRVLGPPPKGRPATSTASARKWQSITPRPSDWYGKAAGHKVAEAQFQLGRMVTEGKGTRLNTDEGLYWIKNAALKGHVEAQFAVAMAHDLRRNGALRIDPVEAAAWYGLAAANRHPEAAAAKSRLLATLSEQQRVFVGQRERELIGAVR